MLAFTSVGGARHQCIRNLKYSDGTSLYLSARVAVLLFSKMGTNPKCELHETQTGNAQAQRGLKTINIHLSQPPSPMPYQILLYSSHPQCPKKAVQAPTAALCFGSVVYCTYTPPHPSVLSDDILAVCPVMYSCTAGNSAKKAMTNLPVSGTTNP